MNSDVLKGQWMQIRGNAKQMWGKLTDDDLTEIDGNKDKLIGKLETRYGYTREQAEKQVDQFTNQYANNPRGQMKDDSGMFGSH